MAKKSITEARANTKSTKTENEVPTNSKGFRKNYQQGVVGWQQFLAPLRAMVNLSQHATAVGASKSIMDLAAQGIERETKSLAKSKVKIPKRLAGRLELAKSKKFTQAESATSDYFKSLRKLVDLAEKADTATKKVLITEIDTIAGNLQNQSVKIPGRLHKKIENLS